jgi:hypothetical protein
MVSNPNVENVVNPPSKPTKTNSRHCERIGNCPDAINPANVPTTQHPTKLTISVAAGNRIIGHC